MPLSKPGPLRESYSNGATKAIRSDYAEITQLRRLGFLRGSLGRGAMQRLVPEAKGTKINLPANVETGVVKRRIGIAIGGICHHRRFLLGRERSVNGTRRVAAPQIDQGPFPTGTGGRLYLRAI
jgi:hypothetical protein